MVRAALPALLLAVTCAALLAGAALRPMPGQPLVVVFPPWVLGGEAIGRLAGAPDGWRLRRIAATAPLVALVLDGAADPAALRPALGAWLLLRAPALDCLSPLPRISRP